MDLSQLTKPLSKPPQITIVAAPGAGKTSLGALFPNPVFIQAEEGMSVFETWPEELRQLFSRHCHGQTRKKRSARKKC